MISGISPGRGLVVQNGVSNMPFVGPNPNNPMTGMLRINGSSLEVFNGSSWQYVGASYATVELDSNTQSIIDWAMKKMSEEANLKKLAESNPMIQDALDQLNNASDKLKVAIALTQPS